MIPVVLTHHRIGWLVGRVRPPAYTMSVILKGTYDLKPGAAAVTSESQLEITGDLHLEDDDTKELRYSSDGVLFKPKSDILLVGHACAPAGARAPKLHVGFQVGSFSKVLTVFGDRFERPGLLTSEATAPEPFARMAIGYPRALGGADDPRNPLGKGRGRAEDGTVPLPNVEYPEGASPRSKGGYPAGFGPVPLTWPQRMSKAGTYDKKWQKTRWPWYPEDFDWTFLNAAPADQQRSEYLRGDETLLFENLHPKHAEYRSVLPGIRVRAFYGRMCGSRIRLDEIRMNLDTLWIDMDAEKIALVWRGLRDQAGPEPSNEDYLLAVSEPLSAAPIAGPEYEEKLNRLFFPLPEEIPVRIEERRRSAPLRDEEEEIAEENAEPPSPPKAAGREWCLQRLRSGEGLQGQDLTDVDLSDLDLPKVDFRGAILTRADLRKSRLAEADFTGAVLREADLTEADLARAVLRKADLTAARMGHANLREAVLDEADLCEAYLLGASLSRAHGVAALLTDANLSRADLSEARFPNAMAAGVTLHEANLSKAEFVEASLEGAWGIHVNARGAALPKLRAAGANFAESDFRGARAAGSIWQGAELFRADFSGADLTKAEFEGANLSQARLSGADLKEARLVKTVLEKAEMIRTNLFQASMSRADVRSAEISESNLFEADLMDILTDGARFHRSNLRGTVLEP